MADYCNYRKIDRVSGMKCFTGTEVVLKVVSVSQKVQGTKVCRYNWRTAGSLGWPFPTLTYIYTVSQKKTRHQTLGHNFTNYYPIFKIFSLADSAVNLRQIHA